MIERLLKYKQTLLDWEGHGKNYSLSVDWVELNQLAIEVGNQPFNIGCSSCRTDLATFILTTIKDKGI
jgi:hypothetical protein